jgi:hypothetical protein
MLSAVQSFQTDPVMHSRRCMLLSRMRMPHLSVMSLLFLAAAGASGSAIPVSGTGGFVDDYMSGFIDASQYSLTFSGTNGVGSVSVFGANFFGDGGLRFQPNVIADAVPFSQFINPFHGTATVDGIQSNYFSYSLGQGGGFVTVFDSLGNQLASEALISYISVSKTTATVGSTILSESGTLFILPSPEPGTLGLMLVGLAGFALLLKVQHSRQSGLRVTERNADRVLPGKSSTPVLRRCSAHNSEKTSSSTRRHSMQC